MPPLAARPIHDRWRLSLVALATVLYVPVLGVLSPLGPRIAAGPFTKGGGPWVETIAASGCDAVGLDWTCDIGSARKRVGNKVALQGNMDPSVLYAQPARIQEEVQSILASYGKGNGHVFNLGHGIHTGINPDHVAALVEAVHRLSQPFHA